VRIADSAAPTISSTSMMVYIAARLLFLGLLASIVNAKDILVLLGEESIQESHSTFLSDLKGAGLTLHIEQISSSQLQLQRWGQWLYDGVLVVASKSGRVGGTLDSAYFSEFLDSGRSIFVSTDQNANEELREVITHLGSDLLGKSSVLSDHISHIADLGHTAVLCPPPAIPAISGNATRPILYCGGALTVSAESALTMPVLTPAATAVTSTHSGHLLGPQLVLAAAMQTRKNARSFVIASTKIFSDEYFRGKPSNGNRDFAKNAVLWTFQERGVVRVSNFTHARLEEDAVPMHNTYKINDTVMVELDLHENGPNGWVPHVTDAVQLEYVMLDPYVRQRMRHVGYGHYELAVRLPDQYGVFKWVLDYKALGFSFLSVSELAPLRPLHHDEYPRFILQAYPYYMALITISVAFLATITFAMYLN
jgi:oligosaccharyltransferase complex subunit beta